jgi:hypothetical protein
MEKISIGGIMKHITFLTVLAAVILLVTACGNTVVSSTPEVSPTKTETIAPSPSSTPQPTYTPSSTPTPAPVVVVVTERPIGRSFPVKITDSIWQDYKTLQIPEKFFFERVTWVADVKVDYGGGRILLSGASDGMKPVVVDDILTIKIIHGDGTTDTFEYDFNSPTPKKTGPFDLTEFFHDHDGLNMLYITIFDYGYSAWGTDGLWMVEFR